MEELNLVKRWPHLPQFFKTWIYGQIDYLIRAIIKHKGVIHGAFVWDWQTSFQLTQSVMRIWFEKSIDFAAFKKELGPKLGSEHSDGTRISNDFSVITRKNGAPFKLLTLIAYVQFLSPAHFDIDDVTLILDKNNLIVRDRCELSGSTPPDLFQRSTAPLLKKIVEKHFELLYEVELELVLTGNFPLAERVKSTVRDGYVLHLRNGIKVAEACEHSTLQLLARLPDQK